jgi:hypothetical protein
MYRKRVGVLADLAIAASLLKIKRLDVHNLARAGSGVVAR